MDANLFNSIKSIFLIIKCVLIFNFYNFNSVNKTCTDFRFHAVVTCYGSCFMCVGFYSSQIC